MSKYEAKDLFQLQSELVEVKVDMAVSKAIDRVVDQIDGLRVDLDKRLTLVENRLGSTEASLNDLKKITDQVRTRLIDYGIKAWWITTGGAVIYGLSFLLHYYFK